MNETMDEAEFLDRAGVVLQIIESHADAWSAQHGVDIDASLTGNVLTLVFEDDVQVVVNLQAGAQEIWVAARSGGFHYRYDGQHWRDTRGGPELAEALSQICSEAAGTPLSVKI